MSTQPPDLPPASSPEPPPSAPASGFQNSVITPSATPMNPIIVLVVAIFLSGIAYFLYGQWQKGVASIGAYVVLFVLNLILCGMLWFAWFPLWIVTVLDSYMQAKHLQDGRPIRQWTFFTQAA